MVWATDEALTQELPGSLAPHGAVSLPGHDFHASLPDPAHAPKTVLEKGLEEWL